MMSTTTEWQVCLMDTITLAHRRWFERGGTGEGRIVLEEKNLTRANLHGINFTKAIFSRCDWSNSNISGRFPEAEITECIWHNSLIHSVDFDRASIKSCDFTDTYFGITHFIGTKVTGGDWTRCDLDKSTWTDAVVEDACFERVNLWRSKLHGSHFKGCDFRDGNLMSVKADNAVFENCDFRGTYLRSFRFNNTKFINCGFYGCIGNPKFAGECILIEPDLSEAFDGTEIIEPEQLLRQWKSAEGQSQPEIAISLVDSPQWLNYISRECRAEQADWAIAGMNGPCPMNLQDKDLRGGFAYHAYFRAARFTNCDFTSADLRRTMVQQAEFISCKFDDALLMYLEGRQETSLDVETTEVIFKDCTAKGAYFNRSEFWVGKFISGNWDGSFFNNCIWTLVEFENVSFENTDWRGAKLDGVKFVNCNFKNARFEKAKFIAARFYDCDFRGADFGRSTGGEIISIERCAFAGAKGIWFDTGNKPEISKVVDADLSVNFDGTLVYEYAKTVQDFFFDIGFLDSDDDNTNESPQLTTTETPNQLESTTSEKPVPEEKPVPNINSPEIEKSKKSKSSKSAKKGTAASSKSKTKTSKTEEMKKSENAEQKQKSANDLEKPAEPKSQPKLKTKIESDPKTVLPASVRTKEKDSTDDPQSNVNQKSKKTKTNQQNKTKTKTKTKKSSKSPQGSQSKSDTKSKEVDQNKIETDKVPDLSQLQQELKENKQQLAELRTQLKIIDARIENARRTNIFGRPQSGVNEREQDELMTKINESEARITQNESAIEALKE